MTIKRPIERQVTLMREAWPAEGHALRMATDALGAFTSHRTTSKSVVFWSAVKHKLKPPAPPVDIHTQHVNRAAEILSNRLVPFRIEDGRLIVGRP